MGACCLALMVWVTSSCCYAFSEMKATSIQFMARVCVRLTAFMRPDNETAESSLIDGLFIKGKRTAYRCALAFLIVRRPASELAPLSVTAIFQPFRHVRPLAWMR
eukprot:1139822-Pelagomonas_calceolata.AAC.2